MVFGGLVACRLVELAVAVVDGDLVPFADVDGVGVGEIGDAVGAERDVGVRIVHDGGAVGQGGAEGAGGEVVREAEGVAGLVRGELADALEDHLEHGVVGRCDGLAGDVGREEGFGDEVVLTAAQGAEGDVAFDDLAGARVGDRLRRSSSRGCSGGPTG